MRVLIVGLPYFTQNLYNDLKEYDNSNKYYRLDTYYNRWDRIKAFLLLPFVDVVYSINGTLDNSRLINMALKKKKKVMMTWVGTDVTKAKKLKQVNQDFLLKSNHYCEVQWIQEELKGLNIDAKILNFFNFKEKIHPTLAPGNSLKVLTYISKNREEYYGWNQLVEVAKHHPDVNFTVVGTDGVGEWPSNVDCKGWVTDMAPFFDDNHATLRFVEHDGLSGFVLESLYRGKQVIYSEPLDYCYQVKTTDDISRVIEELKSKILKGENLLNLEGSNFVATNFRKDKILSELIEEFQK